ncbi:hypothetical protein CHH28_15400 [Bacterioplanes sanyensis]|uniref:Uncharacterized protein n=1 Tax=Bacterioplanes sanyensis TaxID=1249553 RepID=A0A222FMR7_9GAMM|nr:hypothetical protein [Bacterioplanes sanyensis]ASP39972.1 hypothetical protein CHH28_15400 [Bacterioplanes sanyensis]
MKHPASTNTLPAAGSACGLRPDPAALTDDVGFDFSAAATLASSTTDEQDSQKPPSPTPCRAYTKSVP